MIKTIFKHAQERDSLRKILATPSSMALKRKKHQLLSRKEDTGDLAKELDFKKNEDGSVSAEPYRYAVFCGKCDGFIVITDPVAAKALANLRKKPEQNQ